MALNGSAPMSSVLSALPSLFANGTTGSPVAPSSPRAGLPVSASDFIPRNGGTTIPDSFSGTLPRGYNGTSMKLTDIDFPPPPRTNGARMTLPPMTNGGRGLSSIDDISDLIKPSGSRVVGNGMSNGLGLGNGMSNGLGLGNGMGRRVGSPRARALSSRGLGSINDVSDLYVNGALAPAPAVKPSIDKIGSTNFSELFDINTILNGGDGATPPGLAPPPAPASSEIDPLLADYMTTGPLLNGVTSAPNSGRAVNRAFKVGWVPKEGSRWEHRCVDSDECIAINGIKTPILHLLRGATYRFDVDQEPNSDGEFENALYFTEDLEGGEAGLGTDDGTFDPAKIKGTPEPCANGSCFLKVDENCPNCFFYQDRRHRCQGGLCIVHNAIERNLM